MSTINGRETMTGRSISILGCGWLGFPLAQQLVRKGWHVRGSTTTKKKLPQLEAANIEPFLISFEPKLVSKNCPEFWQSEILFLNIPPGRREPDVETRFPEQVKSIVHHLQGGSINWVIFAGSTSVYPDDKHLVTEKDASRGPNMRASGRALLHAEEILHSGHGFETTILRFGGLYGYERHPVNYLAGKKELKNGSAPVNLIHRDDCIQIIDQILEKNIKGEAFNCVSDGHPPRCEFYKTAARKLGVEPPKFAKSGTHRNKIVSNEKLKEQLNYSFLYPNPLDL